MAAGAGTTTYEAGTVAAGKTAAYVANGAATGTAATAAGAKSSN